MRRRDGVRYNTAACMHGPLENLFRLARHLAAARTWLTLGEMTLAAAPPNACAIRYWRCSRQVESRDVKGRVRRWRLPGSALTRRAAAVAAVEIAKRIYRAITVPGSSTEIDALRFLSAPASDIAAGPE